MANVHDVAAFIISYCGEMTAMKLQKLVYYSQAWSLVWDDEPLFQEEIRAWANGPVVPALYDKHRGAFKVSEWTSGNPAALNTAQLDTVVKVIDFYGKESAQWLSDLSHQEAPWRDARAGLDPTERGNKVMTPAAIHEYYSSL